MLQEEGRSRGGGGGGKRYSGTTGCHLAMFDRGRGKKVEVFF